MAFDPDQLMSCYMCSADTFAGWGVDYVKIDYCGDHDSVEGHKQMSMALNKTGRHISYMMCRGPYQRQDHWGYAPEVAQGWRATGDHHDSYGSVWQQVNSVKGKGSWSGPYGWAYLDMMMTGGQGCEDQGTGGSSDKGHWNWTTPKHCILTLLVADADRFGDRPWDDRRRVQDRSFSVCSGLFSNDGGHGHTTDDTDHEGLCDAVAVLN